MRRGSSGTVKAAKAAAWGTFTLTSGLEENHIHVMGSELPFYQIYCMSISLYMKKKKNNIPFFY